MGTDGHHKTERTTDTGRRNMLAIAGAVAATALAGCSNAAGAAEKIASTGEALTADVYETLADLRAAHYPLTSPAACYVLGHSSDTDGGGGHFAWDASSLATDNDGTVVKPSTLYDTDPGRWLRLVNDDAAISVRWFGATGDGSTDDTPAIQNAVAAACATGRGAVVYFPPGRYVVTDETVIDASGVVLEGPTMHGQTYHSSDSGTYVVLKADITGAIFRFALGSTTGLVTDGCGVRNLSFSGASRAYSVSTAAIHIENADRFSLRHVRFEGIAGRAILATRSVKSRWDDIDINNCGATDLAAVETAGTSSGYVQSNLWSGLRIENTRSGAAGFKVGTYDKRNKLHGSGFENAPTYTDANGTFLDLTGSYNQVSQCHFNRLGGTGATNAKITVTGNHNRVLDCALAGAHATNGSATGAGVLCQASHCRIDVKVEAVNGDEIAVDLVGSVGSRISLDAATCSGVRLDSNSTDNVLHGCTMTGGTGKAISDSGSRNRHIGVSATSYATAGPVVALESGSAYCAVQASIVSVSTCAEAFLDAGSESQIIGNRAEAITGGHGIVISGVGSQCDSNSVFNIGKTGIFANGGDAASVSNNRVRMCGKAAASTYYGIAFERSTTTDVGGVCSGNTIRESGASGGSHLYDIYCEGDGSGNPRQGYWVVTNNNMYLGGGGISWPTGIGAPTLANNVS